MLQNEAVDDDDLEHFEDIAEETDTEPNTTLMKEETAVWVKNNNDNFQSDSDSSRDIDGSLDATSSSDDDSSEEAVDLIGGDDLNNLQESRTMPSQGRHQAVGSVTPSLLPGGYNPRHREPLHWYLHLWLFFRMVIVTSHCHDICVFLSIFVFLC